MRYAVADLHIGYPWSEEEYGRIWSFMGRLKIGDEVIFLGDTYEFTWLTEAELLADEHYRRFMQICRQSDITYKFLRGNHDSQTPDPQTPFPIIITAGPFPLSIALGRTVLMHGHQFDKLADSWWKRFYYRFAPWVKGMWLDTPAEQKRRQDKDWSLHNGEIFGRAIRYLEESQYRTMVIGHTHDSALITRPESGKKLISLGSLPEDGVYLKWNPVPIFERV